MKKKILVLVGDLRIPGGISNYYIVLGLQKEAWIDYFFANSYKKQSVAKKIAGFMIRYPKYLIKLFRYQAIHLNISFNFRSYFRDMAYLFIARFFGKKVIVFFHGWEFDFEEALKKSALQRWLFKISYGKMDHGIILSKMFEPRLRALGLPEKCPLHLFSTFADDSYINEIDISQKTKEVADRPLTILFLSRILRAKGVFIAIDAFYLVQQKFPDLDIRLVVAGIGSDFEDAKAYVVEKGVKRVEFPGYITGRNKHNVLQQSDIFLFPSYYPEGMPSVNLEAMLYGMPIVTRFNAGTADVVEQGVNGFLTESKDPEVFAGFLEQLIKYPALRAQMAIINHEKVKANYISSNIRAQMLSLYQTAL